MKIIVRTGPMFADKTGSAIQDAKNAQYRNERVLAIRPALDRHSEPFIISRRVIDGKPQPDLKFPARIVKTRQEFREIVRDPMLSLLIIEEGQFFPHWIVPELRDAQHVRRQDKFKVVVVGLNLDYRLRPFDPMPAIMAMADKVRVHTGVCMHCKRRKGRYTQRLHGGTAQNQPGDFGDYEVRCRVCHFIFGEDNPPTP
ncbi:MAG: hypothetical protein IT406_03360 [Candidatus Yanofskybacteria bacterium]|nr:hypothetical protein [Candidatus Yanofskybacteria bacterium]